MQKSKTKTLTFTGMFAALIFIATFAFHAPIGMNGGYVHFGDTFVYMAAAMLPAPFAMIAAAIGAGLSDIMSPGGAVWAVPTVIIKSLCCLSFTSKTYKLLCRRNIAALFAAAIITLVGYGAATCVISGGIHVALAEAPLSLVQSTGSAICFLVLAVAFDRTKVKDVVKL